jgi:hypothetical protein
LGFGFQSLIFEEKHIHAGLAAGTCFFKAGFVLITTGWSSNSLAIEKTLSNHRDTVFGERL